MLSSLSRIMLGALCFASTLAHADWLCSKKETDATPLQQALITQGRAAIAAAFKPPPEGWTMSQPSTFGSTKGYCVDFKTSPNVFGASAQYQIKPTPDQLRRASAADANVRKEFNEIDKLPPEIQTKLDALEVERKQFGNESRDAWRANDLPLRDAKIKQAEAALKKAGAVKEEYRQSAYARDAKLKDAVFLKNKADIDARQERRIEIKIAANDGPNDRPKEVQSEFGLVVLGSATTISNQATDKLLRISIRLSSNDRQKLSPAEIDLAKSLVDLVKLQALLTGQMPTLEESSASLAQLKIAISASDTSWSRLNSAMAKEGQDAKRADQAAQTAGSAAAKPATNQIAETAASTTASADKPAAPAATPSTQTASAPAKPTAPPSDPTKDAKDAVNKLRGLFGR